MSTKPDTKPSIKQKGRPKKNQNKSLKISIRLDTKSVTSVSVKIQFIALWCLVGSQREFLFPNGKVFPKYTKIHSTLSDFVFYCIHKHWQKFRKKQGNVPDIRKGLSDFVLDCLIKDIIKNAIPGMTRKPIPKYAPKDYSVVIKCLEKGRL